MESKVSILKNPKHQIHIFSEGERVAAPFSNHPPTATLNFSLPPSSHQPPLLCLYPLLLQSAATTRVSFHPPTTPIKSKGGWWEDRSKAKGVGGRMERERSEALGWEDGAKFCSSALRLSQLMWDVKKLEMV